MQATQQSEAHFADYKTEKDQYDILVKDIYRYTLSKFLQNDTTKKDVRQNVVK